MRALTVQDATAFVLDHATTDELDSFIALSVARQAVLRTADAALIRVDAHVTARRTQPHYATGVSGTVVSLTLGGQGEVFATLLLDEASVKKVSRATRGRFTGLLEGIPVRSLTATRPAPGP
ncbi:hypothetical protein [Streptacidiphilus sp. EB103A]|uniref:hypothetical protein n=1 Tax=Streptacidiphilus sp. EB103A TaxID=3156275 RepID=UPI0035192CCC